jgi:hypothetical protein
MWTCGAAGLHREAGTELERLSGMKVTLHETAA